MKKSFIRFFGLKGSWKWAVRQMKAGKIVRPSSASGSVKFRFSEDNQFRLEWNFYREPEEYKWENAFFFHSDMLAIDWVIYNPTAK